MKKVVEIGREFYGNESVNKHLTKKRKISGNKPFQSLEKLVFEDMPEWKEWDILGDGEFSNLKELSIINCPKLTGSFPKHLPSLEELEIRKFESLLVENVIEFSHHHTLRNLEIFRRKKLWATFGDHHDWMSESKMKISITGHPELEMPLFKDVTRLKIRESCDSLKSIQLTLFPRLKTLEIHECRNFESLSVSDDGGLQNSTSLQKLKIYNCPNMVSVAEGGLPAPNLTDIYIRSCEKLKALPERMCTLLPSLDTLKIKDCPEIDSFSDGGLPDSLYSLTISNCKKLMGGRMKWGLHGLPSLEYLWISGEEEEETDEEEEKEAEEEALEGEGEGERDLWNSGEEEEEDYSFPEECLLPPSLTDLVIRNFPNMKTLDPNGLRHLHSLWNLNIENCPKIESLPDEELPRSLHRLSIYKCPMLKERYKSETGQDWSKIAHIPYIWIS